MDLLDIAEFGVRRFRSRLQNKKIASIPGRSERGKGKREEQSLPTLYDRNKVYARLKERKPQVFVPKEKRSDSSILWGKKKKGKRKNRCESYNETLIQLSCARRSGSPSREGKEMSTPNARCGEGERQRDISGSKGKIVFQEGGGGKANRLN